MIRRSFCSVAVAALALPLAVLPVADSGAAAGVAGPRGDPAAGLSALRAASPTPSFAPVALTGAAREAAAAESTSVLTDTQNDAPAYNDILGATLSVGQSGLLQGTVTVKSFTDPLGTDWVDHDTYIEWGIDVDNDGKADYYLSFATLTSGSTVFVGSALFDRTWTNFLCPGYVDYDAGLRTYAAAVPIGCIGNVPSVRWYAGLYFEDKGTFDEVPNGTVWGGPVGNDGFLAPGQKLPAGGIYQLNVFGTGTSDSLRGTGSEAIVPSAGVSAVSMNVTVTETDGTGYVTVYPCGERPLASNLNFVPGQTVPNAVIAPVTVGGYVCFYTHARTHLLADVNGWFPTNPAGFQKLTPVRVFDTRDGTGGVPAGVRVPSDGTLTVQMTGRNGVPATGVAAVVLNVTVTEPTAGGYITVYPCGARPLASNLNYVAGQTVPNMVIAPVSASGQVCFYALGATHLLADVSGWFPVNPAGFQALTPSRVFDTRDGTGGVPAGVRVASDGILTIPMTGRNGVPATGVSAVSLNVTVTEPAAGGYVTVYPCGTRPLASNLNYVAGQTVPNAVIAPVSASGQVCFYALGATHLLADVNGWFPVNPAGFQALRPFRLFDTRGA